MEGKKISFGFMKTKKTEKPVSVDKKEFIECLEEKSIKIVGGEVKEDKTPLVIPMKPNTLVTAERLKQIAEEVEKNIQDPDITETPQNTLKEDIQPGMETIEQMAIRELIQDAKTEKIIDASQISISVPADKLALEGQKESSLEDYESVPIQDFGLAMLRGMGWAPGQLQSKYKQPQLRPKGLGLGADKVIKENQKKNASKNKDDDLSIVKNAYVKITTGKYTGYYGKVISLDDENGRVMIEITVKKETVSLSEFMMHPVSKAEYDKESRVLNADKYDEFKKSEAMTSQRNESKVGDKEASSSRRIRDKDTSTYKDKRKNKENGRSRERHKRDSSSSEDRSRQRRKDDHSSCDSINSISDKKEPRINKYKTHSSDSDSSDYKDKKSKRNKNPTDKKRDIDKKRKGKKKKRDRDRSPNYRKHKSKSN